MTPPLRWGLNGVAAQVFPRISFGGYLPLGRYSGNARTAHNVFTYTDAHSLKLGKHSLRFAGQFQRQQINTFQPSAPAGSYSFGSGYTDLPGITGTGSEFGSFLLGGVEWGDVTDVTGPSYFRESRYVLSATDTWEPRSGLTISLAATSETTSPRAEKYNRQSTVDLQAINPANGLPGRRSSQGSTGLRRSFSRTFLASIPLPRWRGAQVGIARALSAASYARSYQAPPLYSSQWGTQGFNATQTFDAQNAETTPAFFLAQGGTGGNSFAGPDADHGQRHRARRWWNERGRPQSTNRAAFPMSGKCRFR